MSDPTKIGTGGVKSPRAISTILVPTDFSSTATNAVDYAASFAERFSARLLLLHAIQLGDYVNATAASEDPTGAVEALATAERTELELQAAALSKRFGIRVDSIVVNGPAPSAILDLVVAGDIDLVILGTHGRTALRHVLLGSVAEEIVRKSPVPVLTVRG